MHETGFKTALTKVMNEYARANGLLKEKDMNLTGEDFREGICAVISLKMKNVLPLPRLPITRFMLLRLKRING